MKCSAGVECIPRRAGAPNLTNPARPPLLPRLSPLHRSTARTQDYSEYMRKAAQEGRKIIAAIENPLYLSNYNNYQTRNAYEYDPCRITDDNYKNQINTTAECDQVIGMAAAMWTSDFDASNLENSLWPRGFAMAERAWSPSELGAYTNGTASRLGDFRCALMQRGVNVSPLKKDWSYTYGSSERVGEAGSCRDQ